MIEDAVLRGLARNPSAPAEVLPRLLDPDVVAAGRARGGHGASAAECSTV